MKVFSVIGLSKSGKTTTIENIIKELRRPIIIAAMSIRDKRDNSL
jgi:molybdopterin-guanine dinucleotide biosynthesis protein